MQCEVGPRVECRLQGLRVRSRRRGGACPCLAVVTPVHCALGVVGPALPLPRPFLQHLQTKSFVLQPQSYCLCGAEPPVISNMTSCCFVTQEKQKVFHPNCDINLQGRFPSLSSSLAKSCPRLFYTGWRYLSQARELFPQVSAVGYDCAFVRRQSGRAVENVELADPDTSCAPEKTGHLEHVHTYPWLTVHHQ